MRKQLILLLLLLLLLGGCQLAQPEIDDATADRQIGVYLTPMYLDFGDSQRLYGVLEDERYRFEVDGYAFFSFVLDAEYGRCDVLQNELSDGSCHLSVTDEGESRELAGTLYVTPQEYTLWYFNPVWQSADGQVYLTAGQGMSGNLSEGASFSQRFDNEITATNTDGEKTVERLSCEITVEAKQPPVEIRVFWMGQEHQVLHSERYDPAAMPEKLHGGDAAYLTTELVHSDGSVTRSLCEPGEDPLYIRTYALCNDGTLTAIDTPVEW